MAKVSALKRKKMSRGKSVPWNKGISVGRKRPLTLKQIHAIRVRLKATERLRELALFDLAIDSSLPAIDLVRLRVRDIAKAHRVLNLATISPSESDRPIQFWTSAETRKAVAAWIAHKELNPNQYLFPTRLHASPYISVRQYARLIEAWVGAIGLDARFYGTESLRRTKPALVYRRTKDLSAAQSLLRHVKLESTTRYLGA
jgi:site-specific recombinase XerD